MSAPERLCVASDRLLALLGNDLSSQEEIDIQEHLDSCDGCRERLESLAAEPGSWQEASRFLVEDPWRVSKDRRHLGNTSEGQKDLKLIQNILGILGPTDDPTMLGRLGRYEVSAVVGSGGMGSVLKARDQTLDRIVAIKVLSSHLASSGASRQRFEREAKAAAAVVHEHVVSIHNVDKYGDVPFLVMQFVAGESLQCRVEREGPLPAKEVLRIGIQIAAGLAAAHEQGVIHRDVKPANILLERHVERAMLTDFGLARTVDDASLTRSGVVAGTPHYMSPEQSTGQATDRRTDLFSLGAVLYFMATGHPPFRAERVMAVLNRICHESHRPLWQVNDDVPDELSILIDRLLEKRPSKRLSSAEAVREQLATILANLQEPNRRPVTRLRRILLRYPKRILGAVGTFVLVVAVAAIWTSEAHRTANQSEQTELRSSNDVAPVFSKSEATEFQQSIDEIREGLDRVNEFEGVFEPLTGRH